MLVTATDDHITHASVGAKNTRKMGMSSSAEFFQVLSASLYSNPILAPIREVICNADDIHKVSGVDRPIEIQLTEDSFVVRDFGPGISDEMILPIYGMYGDSTKKKSEKETGGFGLGSKSPFAYVDSFEVISCHKGKKTIYTMSKSDAENNGEPSIVTVLSIPTEETGIQVTMRIKPEDKQKFQKHINDVLVRGSINATWNGTKVDVWNIPENMEWGVLGNECIDAHQGDTSVVLRYGAVVYPVQDNPEYAQELAAAKTALKMLSSRGTYTRDAFTTLVLFAPPNSISVAPSREQLSYSALTVATIKELLPKIVNTVQGEVRELLDKEQESHVEELIKTTGYVEILRAQNLNGMSFTSRQLQDGPTASSLDLMNLAIRNNPNRVSTTKAKEQTLKKVLKDKSLNKFFTPLAKDIITNRDDVFSRILRHMSKMSRWGMDIKDLGILSTNSLDWNYRYGKSFSKGVWFDHSSQFTTVEPELEEVAELLNGVLILVHRKEDLEYAIQKEATKCGLKYMPKFCFIYKVGRTTAELQKARDFAKAMEFTVIDMTVYQPLAIPKAKVNGADTKVRYQKTKEGILYVSALNAITPHGLNLEKIYTEDPLMVATPKCVMLRKANKKNLEYAPAYLSGVYSSTASELMVTLWGQYIAVVPTEAMYEDLKSKGCLEPKEFLIQMLTREIKESKTFYADWMYKRSRIQGLPQFTDLSLGKVLSVAQAIYGKEATKPTERDELLHQILTAVHNQGGFDVVELFKPYNQIPLDKKFVKLCHKLASSPVIQFIDFGELYEAIASGEEKHYQPILKFIFKHSEKFQ